LFDCGKSAERIVAGPPQSLSATKAIRIDPLQQLRGVHRSDEGVVVADGHINVAAPPVRIHG
jgi:hypothetical protein